MTSSKNHQVRILCGLKGIDLDSDEAQEFYNWSVLDLLNAIKAEREASKPKEVPRDEEEEEDFSFAHRAGCRH
jgi:hypothetical protein